MFNTHIECINNITTIILLICAIFIIIIIIRNNNNKDSFSQIANKKILMINDNYDNIEAPLDITEINDILSVFNEKNNIIKEKYQSLNLTPDFSNIETKLNNIDNASIKYNDDTVYIHIGCADKFSCNKNESTGLVKSNPPLNSNNYWVGILRRGINRIGRGVYNDRIGFKIHKE